MKAAIVAVRDGEPVMGEQRDPHDLDALRRDLAEATWADDTAFVFLPLTGKAYDWETYIGLPWIKEGKWTA